MVNWVYGGDRMTKYSDIYSTATFTAPPKIAGSFVAYLGHGRFFKFTLYRKPRLLTRLMAKWFFELEWRDE